MTAVRRVIQIPVYWLLVGLAVGVVSPLLSIVASVQIADRNAAHQREEQRRQGCAQLSALLDTYAETPPTTDVGRNIQATYLDFYRLAGCQPARK